MDKEAIARGLLAIAYRAEGFPDKADSLLSQDHDWWYEAAALRALVATLSLAEPSPESREGVEYVIWSNEHRAWWAPNRCGYTSSLERAGRYDRVEAISIAHSARGGWNMAKQAEKNPPEIAMPLADALAQDAKAPAHD